MAPLLIEALPEKARFALGDTHYDAQNVREACTEGGRFLVTSKRGPYPHTDAGVEVRRIFHELRSRGIENFNGQFESIFDGHGRRLLRGYLVPLGSRSGPSLSTDWPCSTDTSMSGTRASGSKPFSGRPEL